MKSVFVLTLIGFFSALLLYGTNKIAEKSIEKAVAKAKIQALKKIFPFKFESENISKVQDKKGRTFFEIKDKKGKLKGIALEVSGEKGYGGKIEVLMAVSPKGKVFDYCILSHNETPGLGSKIEEKSFRKQFKGKDLKNYKWKVKQDKGDVDAITGATISSRAITDILENGLKIIKFRYIEEGKKCGKNLKKESSKRTRS